MIAYKGISPDMTARLGNRDGEIFKVGCTYTVKQSKTARNGYHCCENPAQCLGYYSLESDRFFKVEAAGSIDEDDAERIACTKLTILAELDIKDFFCACIKYIVTHPDRQKWEWTGKGVEIARASAKASTIAIARGEDPRAMITEEGGFIGLIMEDASGRLITAKTARIDNIKFHTGTWYHINDAGIIEEVRSE